MTISGCCRGGGPGVVHRVIIFPYPTLLVNAFKTEFANGGPAGSKTVCDDRLRLERLFLEKPLQRCGHSRVTALEISGDPQTERDGPAADRLVADIGQCPPCWCAVTPRRLAYRTKSEPAKDVALSTRIAKSATPSPFTSPCTST
jgi:hypothetical protein